MQCLQIPYPHLAYHTLKFVFQRKELVIFDLISFWEQNEPNWSAIFLLCQMKLSRATVIMSLQVCLIPKKCLRGIFFSCRKAELQRTLCPCSKVESAVLSWSWQIYLTCLKKKSLHWEHSHWNLHRMSFPVRKHWVILPGVSPKEFMAQLKLIVSHLPCHGSGERIVLFLFEAII